MNIVGQLAETVYVTVKELYRGLNPATLTGGIDVIVVRQPDGSFQCSPFHVRFGKLGVLHSKEKVVDIEINGEPVDLHMKLGDNGEAFFVEENENSESQVPPHLCTSPIPSEVMPDREETTEGVLGSAGSTRRKKRRRRRARLDNHLRDDAGSSSDDMGHAEPESPVKDEPVTPPLMSKSEYYSVSEAAVEERGSSREAVCHSDGERSLSDSVFTSRPTSPKSDSELLVKSHERCGPQVQWNWGGFPTVCQWGRVPIESHRVRPSASTHFRSIERQDSFDLGRYPEIRCGRVGRVTVVRPHPRTRSLDFGGNSMQAAAATSEESPHIGQAATRDVFKSCLSPLDFSPSLEESRSSSRGSDVLNHDKDFTACQQNKPKSEFQVTHKGSSPTQNKKESRACALQIGSPSNTAKPRTVTEPLHCNGIQQQSSCCSEPSEQGSICSAPVSEGNRGVEPFPERGEEIPMSSSTLSGPIVEKAENSLEPPSTTEQLNKRRGKQSCHLGPTGIYLDDLTKLNPEVAALYFPKSEAEGVVSQQGAGPGPGSWSGSSQSPQSVGSGALDSGTEYLSDSTTYSMDISMSLCGSEGDASRITKEKFMQHIVTYQDLASNPGIIEDPNLVICINSNYYNWAVAAPMLLSMSAFQKNLPKSSIERLVKDKMPKKSGRWWFSWRRRDMDSIQPKQEQQGSAASTQKVTLDDPDSDELATLTQNAAGVPIKLPTEDITAQCINQLYRKSLRLTSKQIERLNLREGANKVMFSVTTQYQGTCRCEATIYLWNHDDHIIISDIDGTITKSDALGHILPQFGKDWTHKGIARLYHRIHQNGYKFLYCSARAIGMASMTKDYLHWVNDQGTVLPKGPILLAPSSLFSALHREVIEKKPEVFKVACLSDIRDLFNPHRRPFYAAFGNRTNDAFAYQQVGVPDNRIFTVNPKGELRRERTKGNKSSYSHLSELVEHFFPMLSVRGTSSAFDCPEFSSFSFWREPLPPLELDALL